MSVIDREQAAAEAGHPEWVALPTSEKEAKEVGVNRYFTGRPCKRGHITLRLVPDRLCQECQRLHWRRYNSSAKGRKSQERYDSSEKGTEKRRAYDRSDKKKESDRQYWKSEAGRAANVAGTRRWQKKHPEKFNAYSREYNLRRKADTERATPSWLSDAQRLAIVDHYAEAARLTKETGEVHHVDHIVPLKAKCPRTRRRNASGLHVPWNLQVLTASENTAKGCWFDPDEPVT